VIRLKETKVEALSKLGAEILRKAVVVRWIYFRCRGTVLRKAQPAAICEKEARQVRLCSPVSLKACTRLDNQCHREASMTESTVLYQARHKQRRNIDFPCFIIKVLARPGTCEIEVGLWNGATWLIRRSEGM